MDIFLRLTVTDGGNLRFAWSKNGKKYTACGKPFKMHKGRWIGAKFGYLSIEPPTKADRGWVEADWIRVTK